MKNTTNGSGNSTGSVVIMFIGGLAVIVYGIVALIVGQK